MSIGSLADAQLGVPVQRSAYPEGEEGIQKSLSVMAQKIREGYSTAAMKSFAGNVLRQMGFPKTPDGVRARCEALLDYVRKNVTYAPDAPSTEQIQSASISLCVDGAPICIPIGDCDDLCVALATLIMAAGMYPVNVIRQFFGSDLQQHVLIEVQDENGRWIPLDPSTKYPAGKKANAVRETRIDPLEGVDSAEFVGIGGLPVMEYDGRSGWHELSEQTGLGALMPPPPVSWMPHGNSPSPTYTPPATQPCPNYPPCVPNYQDGGATSNPRAQPPAARGDSKWYRVDSTFAAYPLVPEQVTFYANDWYYKDGNGAMYKYACCAECAEGQPCGSSASPGVPSQAGPPQTAPPQTSAPPVAPGGGGGGGEGGGGRGGGEGDGGGGGGGGGGHAPIGPHSTFPPSTPSHRTQIQGLPAGMGRGGGGGGGGHGGGGGGGGGGHGGGGGGHGVMVPGGGHGGGGGGGGHGVMVPGGGHGGGHGGMRPGVPGHAHPGHFGHRLRRFFRGFWWGWDGWSWYVIAAPTCAWGPPLQNPPGDLYAEAVKQVAAQGPGVIETWTDGVTYLFGPGPSIYPCVGGLTGVGSRARPFG
jgi:hypothetical protein